MPGRLHWSEKVPNKDEAPAEDTGLIKYGCGCVCVCVGVGVGVGCPAFSEITGRGAKQRLLNLVWEEKVRFSI